MKKVIIIGCPGSGKSTFARALHNITGLPLYYLDMLYWNADKTIVPKTVFLERLNNAMCQSEWIIDGNYASTMELRLKACDTVFFLDYPASVCLEGIELRKDKPRDDMPWFEKTGDAEDVEFISYIKNYNIENRPKVIELLKKYSDKNIIVFHSREEAYKFFESLK